MIRWMLQGSVGGLCSFCRCKYNRDIHFDDKLYFSLCTFICSIIGQIIPVVCMRASVCKTLSGNGPFVMSRCTTAHPRENNPASVALWGCSS